MYSVFQDWLASMSPADRRPGRASPPPIDAAVRPAAAASRDDFPLQGLTLSVGSFHTLAIECPLQCSLKVLAGRAWITVDGACRDMIAEPLDEIPLSADARTNLSALYDVVTVLISVPGHFHDAAFTLREADGIRVLSVTTGRDRMSEIVQALRAPVLAAGRRFRLGEAARV